jgi:AraC-like DNA-binding protein
MADLIPGSIERMAIARPDRGPASEPREQIAPAIPLIRVAAAGPLLALLSRREADTERYLERAAMPRAVLAHPTAFIPLRQLARVLSEAVAGEQKADLGLAAGREAHLEELGTYGRLATASRTIAEAIDSAVALMPAFSSGERWRSETIDGEFHLYHSFLGGLAPGEVTSEHYTMSMIVNLVRRVAGPTWRPREVHWQTDYSAAVVDHEMFRGTRFKFARREACITIPTRLLDQPLPRVAAERLAVFDVEKWRASTPPADLLGALREVIAVASPHGGPARIERVAAALGLSVRTFQRRLERSGLCFEDVTKEMRLTQAVDLLTRTEARILDIALDLGYSDHAHFTSAFRGWMGLSPIEYRRRQRTEPVVRTG